MVYKVFYLNDERKEITVKIMDNRYDPFNGTGMIFEVLQKAEGKLYEVDIPANHVLWVKKWPGMVMISSIDPAVLTQSDGDQPRSGAV